MTVLSLVDRLPPPDAARAVVATDASGLVRHVTADAERLLGYSRADLVGESVRSFLLDEQLAERHSETGGDDLDALFAPIRSRAVDHDRQCWTCVRQDGSRLPVRATVTGVYGSDGELVAFAIQLEEIAEGLDRLGPARRRTPEPRADDAHLGTDLGPRLRRPLTNIIGYTEMLHSQAAGALNPHQQDMLERVESNAMRLLEMLRTVLQGCTDGVHGHDLVGTSPHPLEAQAGVDLSDVLVASAQRHARDLDAKRLGLDVDIQERPVPVVGSARDLAALVDCLVGNAVKFTPAGGRVSLALELDADACVLTVADTGCGIPEDELPLVFDRLFRSSVSHDLPGAGLGLASARAIASMHHGTIEVTSLLGAGSVFTVRLPSAPVSVLAAPPTR